MTHFSPSFLNRIIFKPRTARYNSKLLILLVLFLTLLLGAASEGEQEGDTNEKEEDKESEIPDPTTHRYHEEVKGDMVVREYVLLEVHPRSALLCPRGFAITKLRMLMRTGKDILAQNPDLIIPYAHWLVKPDDGVASDDERGKSMCPTLQRCLGYQACLFNFGIEFCHQDPIPGQRKNLHVMLTCLRDAQLVTDMEAVHYDQEYVQEISRRSQFVLHLTYTSLLEDGVMDYSQTEVWGREAEEGEVFRGRCDPLEDAVRTGYRGQCLTQPPGHLQVNEGLWSLLGRVPSTQCREEVSQIYCSFLYHHKGLCLPPFVLQPGQASNAAPETLRLAHNSMPSTGSRPAPLHSSLLQDPRLSLTPARIGFVILAHKDPSAVLQLLRLIYRPQHYYVLHLDRRQAGVRKALADLIAKHLPAASNIRILPPSRSFIASWGSYNIVRSELEAFEELLRMGLWDFGVKLSGADLPIRDVDDLSATLAPYRGHSFVPLFGQRNTNMKADQGLVWDVWHGCDGYVYNVTRGGGQPHPEEIPIYTGSQWSILSWVQVENAVMPDLRASVVNRWHYHLQTSIIPDESYFPTTVMNSPYVNKSKPLGFHWLKQFEGRNTINLCRHMEDADFCGQGPGPIEEGDLQEIVASSHRYFFARKFHTADPYHPTRLAVEEHVQARYYQEIRKRLPATLMRQLVREAHRELLRQDPSLKNTTPGNILALKVLPTLHLRNPCCSLPFERSFKSTQEFHYWLDFAIVGEDGWVSGAGRARVIPRPSCDCYPDGHLRAVRVTTWPEDPNSPRRSGLTTNMPFPFAFPGADTVFVEIWFHVGTRSVTQECREKGHYPPGSPMVFKNLNFKMVKGDPLKIVVQLRDPRGNTRCEQRKTDVWDSHHVHVNRDHERVEMPSFFTLSCGFLEPGCWTLRVFQEEVKNPRHYELPVVVLPGAPPSSGAREDHEPDFLHGIWTVEQVVLLPLPDFYGDSTPPSHHGYGEKDIVKHKNEKGDQDEGIRKEEEKNKKTEHYDDEKRRRMEKEGREGEMIKETSHLSRHQRAADDLHHHHHHQHDSAFDVKEWIACGGGLLTTMLTAVFAYHWVILPGVFSVRPSPRMRRSAVMVFAAVLMQIILSSCYCR